MNCARFVLNCVALYKFCAQPALEIYAQNAYRVVKSKPSIRDFEPEMDFMNFVHYVLNCAAYFTLWARLPPFVPLARVSDTTTPLPQL